MSRLRLLPCEEGEQVEAGEGEAVREVGRDAVEGGVVMRLKLWLPIIGVFEIELRKETDEERISRLGREFKRRWLR